MDGPAKTDLDGYLLRLVTSTWYNNDGIIHPEELTGEVINDAVYNANLGVAQTYNCGFDPIILDSYPAVTQAVGLSVKSGMDEYDMSYNHDNQTSGTMASEIAKTASMVKKQLEKTNDVIRRMNEEWANP